MWKKFLLLSVFTALNAYAEPLAKVNGIAIDRALLDATLKNNTELAKQTENKQALLEQMIAGELLLQQAKKEKIDQQPATRQLIAAVTRQILADETVKQYLAKNPVTEAEIKSRFEQIAKDRNPNEYRSRHILLRSEPEAQDVLSQLKQGAAFELLAKEKSLDDANKANGGEIGWAHPDKLVKPYSLAMQALQPGETGGPVKTQFGWHVLQVLETRPAAPANFDLMKQDIAQQLTSERTRKFIEALKKQSKIQYLGQP
jgi:peptidyl-prolyl cis-trans isomerase C